MSLLFFLLLTTKKSAMIVINTTPATTVPATALVVVVVPLPLPLVPVPVPVVGLLDPVEVFVAEVEDESDGDPAETGGLGVLDCVGVVSVDGGGPKTDELEGAFVSTGDGGELGCSIGGEGDCCESKGGGETNPSIGGGGDADVLLVEGGGECGE